MPLNLDKRIENAGKFVDDCFHLQYLRYFDILAQVHSVVENRKGTWVLRAWRAQRFGPEKYLKKREENLWRITQESFNRYVVVPEPRIAKAIEVHGKEMLMEIEVYDEHRDILETLTAGDFVAITNVHYARYSGIDSLVLHGGTLYDRGISKVPENHEDANFQALKEKVERALNDISDYETYVEFVEQSKTASMQASSPSVPRLSLTPRPSIAQPRRNSTAATPEQIQSSYAQQCSKIIIGEDIAVDWFGRRDAKKYHFLTHAHTDHCRTLDRRWAQKVYCSIKTALILPQIMGYESERAVPPGIIHPLEEDVPHQFDGFTVTLIDANHCPGSVMFVFEGEAIPGGLVLCTGDFRADGNFMMLLQPEQKLHWLTQKKFAAIYLDNTYFSLSVGFPDRETAVLELLEKAQEHPDKNIYIPLHRLGREEMIEKFSTDMNEPVMVYEEKKTMASAMSYLFEFGIKSDVRTIRVVKRNNWQLVEDEDHIDFVIFNVSMDYHLGTSDSMIRLHESRVVRIPYSDHSSRGEIIEFLASLCYSSVIPCSKRATRQELEMMFACSSDKGVSVKEYVEKLRYVPFDEEEEARKKKKQQKMAMKMRRREKELDRKHDELAHKQLNVDQRSPREKEPEPLHHQEPGEVPVEDDDDDLTHHTMKKTTMETSMEAMVESTAQQGMLVGEEDEEPSHITNPLNIGLEMDQNLKNAVAQMNEETSEEDSLGGVLRIDEEEMERRGRGDEEEEEVPETIPDHQNNGINPEDNETANSLIEPIITHDDVDELGNKKASGTDSPGKNNGNQESVDIFESYPLSSDVPVELEEDRRECQMIVEEVTLEPMEQILDDKEEEEKMEEEVVEVLANGRRKEENEKENKEDEVEDDMETETEVCQHEDIVDAVEKEKPEAVVSDEESEEEEVLERNLDLWSEGPPKTLKEAIARLQQRPPRRRKRNQ